MADAEYTYRTVLDELKEVLKTETAQWMSDSWFKSKIFEHFRTDKQTTYSFGKRATGVWTLRHDGRKIWLYDMSFTGQDDCEYTVNCTGSIELTVGTDTNTTLTVSGTEINFPELVVDVIQYLITHKAQLEAASVGAMSFTPMDEERLQRVAEMWRGITAL